MQKLIDGKRITLGTCYYPEHWPEEMWEEDLARMREHGIETVRIAEFAWSKVEPREGVFTYEFFDRFLELAKRMGMQVIFGTPTATPPAWLTEKYPEVLNARMDGVLYRHGARRHYNYNSPVYLEKAALITEKLAAHYGPHPAVIGWQIDNELNCEKDEFYSESDTAAFREFLKEKYGTVEALNDAWGTVFWNQTYTCWEEVHVPRTTLSNSTNPHEVLDYYRFVSASARRFAKRQSDIIKKYRKPGDFITTNGLFGNLDNHKMTGESLDFITYDSYPNFAYTLDGYDPDERSLRDRMWSRNLTEARSVSPVFGIMEQQSGANGWNTGMTAPAPRPGQMTLWTMQSVAHGADYISYFRWRTCTFGTEIYWHGILDYSSRDNRRLAEVGEIHRKLECLSKAAGSVYWAKVGLVKDYDNIWDAQLDVWHKMVDGPSRQAIFAAAQRTHTPLDFVYIDQEDFAERMGQYEVLFYPHPVIACPERVRLLQTYVENGGTLVLGCRSGYKDLNGRCVTERLPGLWSKLSGTDVFEYTAVSPADGGVYIDWDGTKLEAAVFNDELRAAGEAAEVLGHYRNCWYEGSAGLIRNRVKKGSVYYFGAAFTEETARVFLEKLCAAEPWGSLLALPEECELAVREKEGDLYFFVLNYSSRPQEITLRSALKDMFSGETAEGALVLPPFGVGVYGKFRKS